MRRDASCLEDYKEGVREKGTCEIYKLGYDDRWERQSVSCVRVLVYLCNLTYINSIEK